MTKLAGFIDQLHTAARLFGLPAEVHGILPLAVTNEDGELSFHALNVTERAVELTPLEGWAAGFAELDLATGAIVVPTPDHHLVRLVDSLAQRIPQPTSWLGLRGAQS
jgi:hypothetical protein